MLGGGALAQAFVRLRVNSDQVAADTSAGVKKGAAAGDVESAGASAGKRFGSAFAGHRQDRDGGRPGGGGRDRCRVGPRGDRVPVPDDEGPHAGRSVRGQRPAAHQVCPPARPGHPARPAAARGGVVPPEVARDGRRRRDEGPARLVGPGGGRRGEPRSDHERARRGLAVRYPGRVGLRHRRRDRQRDHRRRQHEDGRLRCRAVIRHPAGGEDVRAVAAAGRRRHGRHDRRGHPRAARRHPAADVPVAARRTVAPGREVPEADRAHRPGPRQGDAVAGRARIRDRAAEGPHQGRRAVRRADRPTAVPRRSAAASPPPRS